MFEVAYETTFCATHVLHDGGRPIEPQHGHDWRVEVVAAGETLDRLGVVRRLRAPEGGGGGASAGASTTATSRRHPDFAGQSPSAEAVARYFFREVQRGPGGGRSPRCVRVRVWEAPGCSATYGE